MVRRFGYKARFVPFRGNRLIPSIPYHFPPLQSIAQFDQEGFCADGHDRHLLGLDMFVVGQGAFVDVDADLHHGAGGEETGKP